MSLFTALALATATQPAIRRIWHYERSNIAGGEAEQVYVYRASATRVEVYKMRERCTNAALVSATIDPATGQAALLEAATLLPGATSKRYAVMIYDSAAKRIVADVEGDEPIHAAVTVTESPWHLYDYDLATLSMATQAMRNHRRSFSFGLALVWVGKAPRGDFLNWLGRADARFVRTEKHLGRESYRYAVSGPAFGTAGGGPLWIDAGDGSILDVQWGRPNHAEYSNFRLRLIDTAQGAPRWTALLKRHFQGCPAPSAGS